MIKQLNSLKEEILEEKGYSKSEKLFEGARLIITNNFKKQDIENIIIVKTQHAYELSNLIFKLKDIFKNEIDYLNKYVFYARLGKVALHYLENNEDNYLLLIEVIDEAIKIANKMNKIYYFAYGSNMDEKQMFNRCHNPILIGKGILNNYKFELDSEGVATIINSKNDIVYGIVWEISIDDKKILDKYEGVRNNCYKPTNLIIKKEDKDINALTYISLRDKNDGIRRKGYLEKIFNAAKKYNFPEEYLKYLSSF